MGADAKANTMWGGGALQLLEHAPFPLMQLAIMMAEATPSLFTERSIFLVGFVPLSLSIGSACRSILPRGEACSERQRALTQKRILWSWFERQAAYRSDCSVELPLRPSAIAASPSGPSWL